MPDTFIPLVPPAPGSHETTFSSLQSKGLAQGARTNGANGQSEACARPVITLQRNGDIVSGIRIECGCGQVIDLTCVY